MDANPTEGLFPLVTHTVSSVAGLLEDVVNETRAAIAGTLDLGEAISKSALRFSRKLNDRVAELALDAIARGRSTGIGVVGLADPAAVRLNGGPAAPAPRRTGAQPNAS